MRQWKSLVPALHLHGPAASCFPHPPSSPSPSPCPSPPRAEETDLLPPQAAAVVRLVGCDGRVRAYAPPVTARQLMQEHPRHLVCRADALLIGEKIPAVAPGEELQPGQAYFLLPAHLFRSVLSFVSLASSLLLLLSSSTAAAAGAGTGKKPGAGRPFELHRTASGTLQIKFSDDFLLAGGDGKGVEDDDDAAAAQKEQQLPAVLLRGDDRLAKDYEELVGYGKSRRWAPKLETIQEAVAPAPAPAAAESADPAASPKGAGRGSRRSRALPFLGRLGSRRRSSRDRDACSAAVACSG